MRITFILSVANHVRYRKRIAALERVGVNFQVLSFEREHYVGKPWPGYESLGYIAHGNYLQRLVPIAKSVGRVRRAIFESDVIYVFGLDTLLLVWLARAIGGACPKLVYEVGDIRGILIGNRLSSKLLRRLERFLVRRSDILVVTSQGYIDGYFLDIQGLTDTRYHVIENKLDSGDLTQTRNAKRNHKGPIYIGYFGLIRCKHSFETLMNVVERGGGEIKLILRGIPRGIEAFEERISNSPHVHYGGPYVWPDDLPAMYNAIDVVWVAHYHAQANLQWARANRFYESCFFGRPMIAQRGTEDGRVIENLNLGLSVNLVDTERSVQQILGVTRCQLDEWQENVRNLPDTIYTYSDEHEKLLQELR